MLPPLRPQRSQAARLQELQTRIGRDRPDREGDAGEPLRRMRRGEEQFVILAVVERVLDGIALLFAASEVVTLALNFFLYQLVVTRVALGPAGAVLARAVTTNLVFLLWSYPVGALLMAAMAFVLTRACIH